MSLKFKVLDERNTGTIVETKIFSFFPGEDRTLRLQLVYESDLQPYMVPAGATVSISLPASPSTLVKSATVDSGNRSIVTVTLAQADTTSMTSGNIIGEVTDGASKRACKSVAVLNKLNKVPN